MLILEIYVSELTFTWIGFELIVNVPLNLAVVTVASVCLFQIVSK